MDTPCWQWTGEMGRNGYGIVQGGQWLGLASHRVAWMEQHGPIPDGKQVLHKCDNRHCVRGDHLYLGDALQNIKDQVDRKRYALDPWIQRRV